MRMNEIQLALWMVAEKSLYATKSPPKRPLTIANPLKIDQKGLPMGGAWKSLFRYYEPENWLKWAYIGWKLRMCHFRPFSLFVYILYDFAWFGPICG